MSDYQIGAFEALEWAWHMLRNYKQGRRGVDDARLLIQETLINMGKGYDVNFAEKLKDFKDLN